MTYGEFLEHCQKMAGCKTKTEFSQLLGMRDADHLIGLINERNGKQPSLDLLQRAAKAAGAEFTDYIQIPKKQQIKISKKDQATVRQLTELLEIGGEAAEWLRGNVKTFHRAYSPKRR